jgi:serine/threonine protein kinase
MRGSTLRELMEERDTFDLCDALDLTSQLLRALLDVHSQGIVHRDIKPDNIMILSTPHGRKHLKLFDFGIAKVLSGKTVNPHEPEIAELLIPLTSAEMTVGTPEYMAPEQISATNVGFHTDIYATGIVMYEMLFGEVPYTGRNFFEIAHKHLAGVLPPLPADLPDVIHQLIWRSLACRTEERFSSADEMLRAVEAAMSETRNTKWNSVSELEADGLSSFISSDVASTWTHVEDSCVELVSGASEADSSAPKEGDWSLEVCEESIDPKQWFDDFSLSNQIQALQAFEVEAGPDREAADQPPPAPPGGMILSSEAMRALTAQLQNPTEEGEVPAAYGLSNERRRKERPPSIVMPKSGGKPPWEVHIDEGEADCAATKDLSLTDMLAVLSDQQVRRPRSKPETATSLFVREHSKKHTRRWHTASGTK